jgi:hypothetical protein
VDDGQVNGIEAFAGSINGFSNRFHYLVHLFEGVAGFTGLLKTLYEIPGLSSISFSNWGLKGRRSEAWVMDSAYAKKENTVNVEINRDIGNFSPLRVVISQ